MWVHTCCKSCHALEEGVGVELFENLGIAWGIIKVLGPHLATAMGYPATKGYKRSTAVYTLLPFARRT